MTVATATVGIENATGTDALQIGFFERILESNHAIRITTVPTGFITGTVTDANDGQPIAGATGHGHARRPSHDRPTRTARTASGCSAGSYEVDRLREPYEDARAPATVVDDVDTTLDFSLAPPTAAVDATEINETVDFGADRRRGPSPCPTTARRRSPGRPASAIG